MGLYYYLRGVLHRLALRFLFWLEARVHRPPHSIDALERLVEKSLAPASVPERTRFYDWIEERHSQDQYTVRYAERIFEWQRREVEKHRGGLEGLRVLELGPGHTLVGGVLTYAHGARSYVGVDLFPVAGKGSSLYRALRKHLQDSPTLVPLAPGARARVLERFDACVKTEGEEARFDEDKVAWRCPVDAAKLPFPDGSFDVVISNASFEHFEDPVAAVNECSRVLAPGGMGLHQIDLRDHRDFSNPLEFLCLEDEAWRAKFGPSDMFCYTNRFRKTDFEAAFRASGVEVRSVDVNMKTTVSPELRTRLHPRFRDRAQDDLEAVSACFVVVRPAVAAR